MLRKYLRRRLRVLRLRLRALRRRMLRWFYADHSPAAGINPRETMRAAGPLVQPFLTSLTGTPLVNQRPLFLRTPVGRVAQVILIFAGSVVAAGAIAIAQPAWWALLPLPWLFTVNAARQFQTSFVHHASHGNLTGRPKLDTFLAELVSTLAFIQPLSSYGPDHRKHHGELGLENDPDLRFLVAMGFKPGMSMSWYWTHLFKTMVSPAFHWMYFSGRMQANFVEAPLSRRLAAIIWAGMLLIGVAATGAWIPFLLAFVLAIFPLFHISGLLQIICEHNYVRIGHGKDPARIVLAKLTSDRFMGEAAPSPSLPQPRRMLAWAGFWVRMLTTYAFARLYVVSGDLTNHSWHHRRPRSGLKSDGMIDLANHWSNAAYARRTDALRGSPGWPPYTEHWGLLAAINATFRVLACLPRDGELGNPMTYEEKRSAMNDM